MIKGTNIAQIRKRMPKGGQLPVRLRDHLRGLIAYNRITGSKIVMHDGGGIIIRQIRRSPIHQIVHHDDGVSFRRPILFAPTGNLTAKIAFETTQITQTNCFGLDGMQGSKQPRSAGAKTSLIYDRCSPRKGQYLTIQTGADFYLTSFAITQIK
ncbi:hypothetical protein O4H61_05795 [Roseovarius aestuarii]|nr:hypothetical protein [Roseovarius aestuarii]